MASEIRNRKSSKKYIIMTIAVFVILFLAYAAYDFLFLPPLYYGYAKGSDPSLLIIYEGPFAGYADANGKTVIQPRFLDANPFYDGFAVVKGLFGYGYIDKTGHAVTPLFYLDADWFSEGLAAVKGLSGYGYIDRTGKTVIPMKYCYADQFYNGIAIVGTDDKVIDKDHHVFKGFIIDKQGNIKKELGYISGSWNTDVIEIYDENGAKLSLDENYNVIGKLANDKVYAGPFINGIARAYMEYDSEYYINKSGEPAFSGTFYRATDFSEGLAAVEPSNSSGWGYIDEKGNFVIPPLYYDAHPFGEGLAILSDIAIIDKQGNEVGRVNWPKVDGVVTPEGSFSDGLCIVDVRIHMRHRYGYMDTTGKMAIDAKFDEVTPFRNGIAQVRIDGKIGYIEKTGKYIWGPK